MEKNELIIRTRSKEDKRVVLIEFSEKGLIQFQGLIDGLMYYCMKVMNSFTNEEMNLFYKMTIKVKEILKKEKTCNINSSIIRKITIM